MNAKNKNQKNIINDAIVKDISDVVHGLSYGIVTIKVHNAKIVQMEVTENRRFDDVWQTEGGGI